MTTLASGDSARRSRRRHIVREHFRNYLTPCLLRRFSGAIWGQDCLRKADPPTIQVRCFLFPFPFAERTYSVSATQRRRRPNVPLCDLKFWAPLRSVRVQVPLRLLC